MPHAQIYGIAGVSLIRGLAMLSASIITTGWRGKTVADIPMMQRRRYYSTQGQETRVFCNDREREWIRRSTGTIRLISEILQASIFNRQFSIPRSGTK